MAKHDSHIARLEQVMTALAEAQVKTEEAQANTEMQMAQLAKTMNALATETRTLDRQWQVYLNTLPKH